MTTTRRKTIIVVPLVLSAALLQAGCAQLQTRPGTPDSYRTGLLGGGYYAPGGLYEEEWPTTRNAAKQKADAVAANPDTRSTSERVVEAPPPLYKATDVPTEIWQARGAAWNLHLKYLAASFKAGEVQDAIAVPLFGAAVATAALGIAKASTVAVAAAGLAGGAITTGYKYAHPDADLTTDQTAAFHLACVVDRSLPLRILSVVPLLLDKAALQDAVDRLNLDGSADSSAGQKAAAVAKETMAQLDDEISAFNAMPSLIYGTVDGIDKTAQAGGIRTVLDYSGILSNLESAAANKSANVQTKANVADAKKSAAKDTAGKNKTKTKPAAASMDHLMALTTQVKDSGDPDVRTALSTKAAQTADTADTGDASASGSNEIIATTRAKTLANQNITPAQTVTQIAGDTNEDLALRPFHIVAANIQACPAETAAAPLYTLPAATPATN